MSDMRMTMTPRHINVIILMSEDYHCWHPHLVVVPRQLLHALPRVRRPDGGQPVPAPRDDLVYRMYNYYYCIILYYVNNIAT